MLIAVVRSRHPAHAMCMYTHMRPRLAQPSLTPSHCLMLGRLFVDKFNTFDIDGFCEEHDVTSTRAKLPRRHGQSSAGNDESTRALLFLSKYLVNSGYDTYLESRGKLIAHEAAMMYKSQRTWAAVVLQRRFRLWTCNIISVG